MSDFHALFARLGKSTFSESPSSSQPTDAARSEGRRLLLSRRRQHIDCQQYLFHWNRPRYATAGRFLWSHLETARQAERIPEKPLFAAADNRLSPDLRDWIEERPEVSSALRALRSSPQADRLIHRLTRFIGRRSPPPTPRGFLITWESELRAIATEASAWTIETGGDLFGRWHDVPAIFLATKAGPNAQRDNAHFRLDVEYLRQLSETLALDWSLRYFGDWHSHHRLGLSAPSGGDRRRILNIAGRNQFTGMAEIIVTLEDTRSEPVVRIHPWLYDLSSPHSEPNPLHMKVLSGLSPVRQTLLTRGAFPDQKLQAWGKMPLNRIRIGHDSSPPALESAPDVDTTTREKTIAHLAEALQAESGNDVERHTTGFGCIIVAEINAPLHLGFALGVAWPLPVLGIHLMNRDDGTTDEIKTPDGLTALDIPRILEIFRAAKTQRKGN